MKLSTKKLKSVLKNATGNNLITIATWLPVFTGFYESIFDGSGWVYEEISYIDESDYEHNFSELVTAGIPIEYFRENAGEYISFEGCYEEAAKSICYALPRLESAGIVKDTEFESLQSPKFYNFSTDSINCNITFNKKKLKQYLEARIEAFTEYIEDRYTSRSGFISSYSNDVSDWLNVDELCDHSAGSVLQFVIFNEYGSEMDAAMELYDASYCYEDFMNYSFDSGAFLEDFKKSKKSA